MRVTAVSRCPGFKVSLLYFGGLGFQSVHVRSKDFFGFLSVRLIRIFEKKSVSNCLAANVQMIRGNVTADQGSLANLAQVANAACSWLGPSQFWEGKRCPIRNTPSKWAKRTSSAQHTHPTKPVPPQSAWSSVAPMLACVDRMNAKNRLPHQGYNVDYVLEWNWERHKVRSHVSVQPSQKMQRYAGLWDLLSSNQTWPCHSDFVTSGTGTFQVFGKSSCEEVVGGIAHTR